MLQEESKLLARMLDSIPLKGISPILNLGSSTLHYRKVEQPFVEELLFSPLVLRQVEVVHSDLKADEGVDLVGNIEDPSFREKLRLRQFQLILANNLFEQVPDYRAFIALVCEIVPAGGYILVSMPYLFPYHNDPIDNDWRPSPEEIAASFGADFHAVVSEISVEQDNYFRFLLKRPRLLLITGVRTVTPFYKPRSWWNIVKYFPHMFRPFRASVVLLQKKHA